MKLKIYVSFLIFSFSLSAKDAEVKKTKKERSIKICNTINDSMTSHSSPIGSLTPTFSVMVNDQAIKNGESLNINLKENQITVRYDFNFLKGMNKGSRAVTFNVKPKTEKLTLSFSWDNEWRVIVDGATPVSCEQIKN